MPTTHMQDINGNRTANDERTIVNYANLIANKLGLEKLTTNKGKEIQIVKEPTRNLFIIEFATGGQKPQEFQGKFTTLKSVEQAVNAYLTKREDAKTESSKARNKLQQGSSNGS